LSSFLVELTEIVLRKKDDRTGGMLVDAVLDQAEQKGTGRWTLETALNLGVSIPTIGAALDGRTLSSRSHERVSLAEVLDATATPVGAPPSVEDLESALLVGKIAAYAQGFALIDAAAVQEKWTINKGEVARIWKAGCIIRARLLDRIVAAYRPSPTIPHLFFDPELGKDIVRCLPALRRVVAWCAGAGSPTPAFSAALNYVQTVACVNLPQNLIQAQRDAFGGHTYLRRDDVEAGPQHSDWGNSHG